MDNLGALFFTRFKGKELSKEDASFIQKNKIGGVLLTNDNFENPSQLAELVNAIQVLRDEYPIFIGVSQEGGQYSSFKNKFTQFPSMYELSRLNSPKIIFDAYTVMANELKACGVNLSLSPVCDIWTNANNKVISERAFGVDSESVVKFSSAALRGLQTSGILACAKHFPGYGNILKNPELDTPIIKDPLDSLLHREVQPFLKASRSRVEMMMMGHLIVDSIDPENVTSLSEKAYLFLRNSTKFTKIILTDKLDVKSLLEKFTIEEIGLKAMVSGADILHFQHIENTRKVYDHLNLSIKNKVIAKNEIEKKISRVDKTKIEYFKEYKPIYIPEITSVFNSNVGAKIIHQYQTFIDGKKTPL